MSKLPRLLSSVVIAVLLSAATPHVQEVASYRGFTLGASVQDVSAVAKLGRAQVQTLHQRPALIQTMEWRLPYSATVLKDPVKQMEFSFYDDRLYRIAVDYDAERTRGMTAADIVGALTATYGPVSQPAARATGSAGLDGETTTGRVIARWSDPEHTVVAYREADYSAGPDGSRFRLIVLSPRVAALSRAAALQSARLDEREAPQREVARRKKEADDERARQDQSRIANKKAFTP